MCVSIVSENKEKRGWGRGGVGTISFVSSTNVLRVYDQEAPCCESSGTLIEEPCNRGSETLQQKVYVL